VRFQGHYNEVGVHEQSHKGSMDFVSWEKLAVPDRTGNGLFTEEILCGGGCHKESMNFWIFVSRRKQRASVLITICLLCEFSPESPTVRSSTQQLAAVLETHPK